LFNVVVGLDVVDVRVSTVDDDDDEVASTDVVVTL
jgi:hypothetical protein